MSRLQLVAAVLLVVLAALALPAQAQTFEDWVRKLAADDFGDKLEAAEKLGDLGDGRAVPALKALSDGALYVRKSDGAALIQDGSRYFDAASGKGLGELPAADVDKVRVNNRLRGVIAASLSKLSLFSTDRATRLAAAKQAFANPTPQTAAALDRALKSEKDPEVLAAIRFSLAAAQVNAGEAVDRVKAIESLAGTADPQVRNLLAAVLDTKDTPPQVRQAAQAALTSIERRLALVGILENVFQGISLGSVLLLAAVGLAITFGVMGVINMAHGEMIMLGAYTAYSVQLVCRALLPADLVGYYLVFSLPIAFLVSGAVGVLLERGVIRYLYGRPLETMLATWGISLVLQQAVRSIFDAQNKEVANPEWMTGGFDLMGGFFVAWNRLYIIIFCFLMLGIIALVLRRTSFGLHMRAVTQNRDMAAAMGIPTARVDALTFGLGSGLAGMAGVALSQIGNVSPNLGQIYIVDSFLVVVFGGVGNLLGTLVASLSLGLINKILEPFAGAVLGKVAVLVFIILFIQWRPRGLFALKGRFVEQ
ncbi:urea ABC transporter permease subunit UrtB [Vineibacter terrae]|uniref:urea ABC transporter permease subunit UrtB n=1 Tax=Vineibacter terrae TaxID=2586908 RepID=UPI002E321E2B|nr:urea ABC transporter permease subunit UrtB [Vineibacter terrae]HEX2891073.1 urea ABC transporter permease subunit UrtB [Vineibacter terrae]